MRARGLAARDAERMRDRGGIEAGDPARGGCRGERTDHTRGMEALGMKPLRGGHADPRRDFVAGHHRRDDFLAGTTMRFGHRDRRRHDRAADVHDRLAVRIVVVVAVRERAVVERGPARRQALRLAVGGRERGAALLAAEVVHGVGVAHAHAREAHADGVQDAQLGADAHLGRQVGIPKAGREAGEGLGDRRVGHACQSSCRSGAGQRACAGSHVESCGCHHMSSSAATMTTMNGAVPRSTCW